MGVSEEIVAAIWSVSLLGMVGADRPRRAPVCPWSSLLNKRQDTICRQGWQVDFAELFSAVGSESLSGTPKETPSPLGGRTTSAHLSPSASERLHFDHHLSVSHFGVRPDMRGRGDGNKSMGLRHRLNPVSWGPLVRPRCKRSRVEGGTCILLGLGWRGGNSQEESQRNSATRFSLSSGQHYGK
jgi:hypothetical protein